MPTCTQETQNPFDHSCSSNLMTSSVMEDVTGWPVSWTTPAAATLGKCSKTHMWLQSFGSVLPCCCLGGDSQTDAEVHGALLNGAGAILGRHEDVMVVSTLLVQLLVWLYPQGCSCM